MFSAPERYFTRFKSHVDVSWVSKIIFSLKGSKNYKKYWFSMQTKGSNLYKHKTQHCNA